MCVVYFSRLLHRVLTIYTALSNCCLWRYAFGPIPIALPASPTPHLEEEGN